MGTIQKNGLLFFSLTFIWCFSGSTTYAETPSPRSNLGCAFLSDQIYCYGGTQNGAVLTDNYFYSLDTSEDMNLDEIKSSWKPVNIPASSSGQQEVVVDPGPNTDFAIASLPNLNLFIVDGGSESKEYRTFTFNVSTNTWKYLDNIEDRDNTTGNCAVADSEDWVYFTGGITGQINVNITNPGSSLFSRQITTLDPVSGVWSMYSEGWPQSAPARANAVGVLGQDGRTVYYIGGRTNILNELASMNDIAIHDIRNDAWIMGNTSSSSFIPPSRIKHSATLNPNTGEILVYGGDDYNSASNTQIRNDYIYVLDPETMTWKNRTLSNASGVNGPTQPLSGHQALFVGNNTLVIMFGANTAGEASNDIYLLDVETYTWVDHISGSNPGKNGHNNNDDEENASLSAGVIAGAVVSSVVGAIILVGVIVIIIIKRRRNRFKNGQRLNEKADEISKETTTITTGQRNKEDNNPDTFTADLFLDDFSKNGGNTKMSINVVSNYSSTLGDSTGSEVVAIKPLGGGPDRYQAMKPDASISTKPNAQ
ncbi:hypothetical protein BDC45DRAFT_284724 [Circinella umbellata]|nr:hypothetical protein BDC45DRAFT_284724 [Circinella umbellata]